MDKHSSLFCLKISDKKMFYDIDTWWLTGQSCKLQNSMTVDGPGQGLSSSFSDSAALYSAKRHVLDRCVVPPPQLLLQLDHSSHCVHSGSLMQGSTLQKVLSIVSPKIYKVKKPVLC